MPQRRLQVRPPAHTLDFDLPSSAPWSARPAAAAALGCVALLLLAASPVLALAAVPLFTASVLDVRDATRLALPLSFVVLAGAGGAITLQLSPASFVGLLVLAGATLALWGLANPATLPGVVAKFALGGLCTQLFAERAFPDRAELITKEFLERALQYPLSSFHVKPLGGGFIGETVRVTLIPASGSGATSVVAKMSPAADRKLRMRVGANVFVKEASFYASVAPQLRASGQCSLRFPETLGVFYGPKSGSSLILMKDESAACRPGDEEKPASWQLACSVAKRYASFHKQCSAASLGALDEQFGTQWLATFDWMNKPAAILQPLCFAAVEEIVLDEELRTVVGVDTQKHLVRLLHNLAPLLAYLERTRPFALSHADSRVENMLFPKATGCAHLPASDARLDIDLSYDKEAAWLALDWQTLSKSLPVYDLAYFAGLDLAVDAAEASDAVDKALVRFYVHELGQEWYSFEQAYRDYQVSLWLASLIPFVVMSAKSIGEQTTTRARTVRLAMLGRVCAAIERTGAGKVLEEVLALACPGEGKQCRVLEPGPRRFARAEDAAGLRERDDAFSHHTQASVSSMLESSKPGTGRRDAYDRWFLNGCSPDGQVFFAFACGFYPGRGECGVVDATFSLSFGGLQRNVRVSRAATDTDFGATESAWWGRLRGG